jgi:hypothetical protein
MSNQGSDRLLLAGKRRLLVPIADIQHEAPSTVGERRLADPKRALVGDRCRARKISDLTSILPLWSDIPPLTEP